MESRSLTAHAPAPGVVPGEGHDVRTAIICDQIAKFGGWSKVKEQFFDEENGSVAKIEEELGYPTTSG